MQYACCDSRVNPRVILALAPDRDAAWVLMDKLMDVDSELSGNVAICPDNKQVGDTLTLGEILAART